MCNSLFRTDLMQQLCLIKLSFPLDSYSTVVMAGRICPAQEFGEELPPAKESRGVAAPRMGTRTDNSSALACPGAVPCAENRMRARREVAVLASRAAALTGKAINSSVIRREHANGAGVEIIWAKQ